MIVLQVFFPLAPGIESIWEPFQEEVEERVQEVQRQIVEAMDGTLVKAYARNCLPNMQNLAQNAVRASDFHLYIMSLCVLESGNAADAVALEVDGSVTCVIADLLQCSLAQFAVLLHTAAYLHQQIH